MLYSTLSFTAGDLYGSGVFNSNSDSSLHTALPSCTRRPGDQGSNLKPQKSALVQALLLHGSPVRSHPCLLAGHQFTEEQQHCQQSHLTSALTPILRYKRCSTKLLKVFPHPFTDLPCASKSGQISHFLGFTASVYYSSICES